MTAQAAERLKYKGDELMMCSCPLGGYLISSPKEWSFAAWSSACWRGYIGRWEVIDGRLYLTELNGDLKSGESVTLETMFPGYADGVFAHWFSGTVRCPQGKLLNYIHGGFASTYEKDLFLEFKSGVLVSENTVVNGVAEEGASEGYALAGFTVFGKESAENE